MPVRTVPGEAKVRISAAFRSLDVDTRQRVRDALNGYERFTPLQAERTLTTISGVRQDEEASGRTHNSDILFEILRDLEVLRRVRE